MKSAFLLLISLGLTACNFSGLFNSSPQVSPKTLTQPSTASLSSPSALLGSVGGVSITQEDLDTETKKEIDAINNQWAQKKLHLLWAGFEDAVNDRLIEQKARAEGLSPELLVRREILEKVKKPTAKELQSFYKANAHIIQVNFETARPHIEREVLSQRRSELEMAFLAGLRAQNNVEYQLPMPELPRQTMPKAPAPFTGPKDAQVVLVEFGDFECPYCAQAHRLVKELRELYPDQLRVEYRHFPLEQHTRATPAAVASQCANEQGMFWKYHDYLYENPQALSDENFTQYAKKLKLNLDQFQICLKGGRAAAAVKRDTDIARKLGVDGTPSIYINGIKLIGLLPLPLIRVIIDHELKQQPGRG